MAAEIAHEVGTPLNVIGGRARALEKKAGDPAEVAKNARAIIQATQVGRITKIINQVLDFSRKRGPTMTRVDLARWWPRRWTSWRETIRRQGITTEVRVRRRAAPVPGDPDQIQQVCLNLLMNAIHAMPAGRRALRVTLESVTRRKGGLDLAAPAAYAMLQIVDSGAGISVADREARHLRALLHDQGRRAGDRAWAWRSVTASSRTTTAGSRSRAPRPALPAGRLSRVSAVCRGEWRLPRAGDPAKA
jgi:signal transduction histidine kinase